MKTESILKHATLAFVLTAFAYGLLFYGDHYLRTRNGGWDITFIHSPDGSPRVTVNQITLGLTNVTLVFSNETVASLNSFVYPTKVKPRASARAGLNKPSPTETRNGFAPAELVPWVDSKLNAVLFDKVSMPIPFGRKKFEDLTYLPGTMAFDFFGHEVEFMPRTMVINLKEVTWTNHSVIILTEAQKIPGLKDRNSKGQRK